VGWDPVGRQPRQPQKTSGFARHFVAVVLDTRDHAVGDAPRVQQAGGELVVGEILGTEAEHVGGRDGPRAHADDVADDATDAGIGAAEGLQRRGVVVGLDLECEIQLVVEGDDARVVDEG